MNFAQIRSKETEANEMFGIEKYPTLVVLQGGDKEPVVFNGELKKDPMNEFLSKYAELRKPAPPKEEAPKADKKAKKASEKAKASEDSAKFEEASASQASEQASDAAASASTITLEEPDATSSPGPIVDEEAPTPIPVPNVPAIPKLATPEELQSKCLGPKTPTCVLALLSAAADPAAELPEIAKTALASLSTLEQKHKARGSHLFPFYAIPEANIGAHSLKSSLGLDAGVLHLIAVNGKRSWWRQYDSEKGFGEVAVEGWVDGIRFGEGKKQKLPESLTLSKAEGETPKAEESKDKQKPIHVEL